MTATNLTENHTTQKRGALAALAAAGFFVACHFAFLMHFYEPAISTLDSHGYYVQAKQFAQTGSGVLDTESRVQYVGPGWKDAGAGRYVSMWPPGLPLILAGAHRVFGSGAVFLVNPVLAALALLAVFLVSRAWFGSGWGFAAMALLGCNPFFNEHAFYGYSHMAALCCMVWGLYFLIQWMRAQSAAWAFATGLFAGYLACIRYPEALFAAAFTVYAILNIRRDGRSWRAFAAYAAGAAIPAAALFVYNQQLYGSFLSTGYSLIGYAPSTLFKWDALKTFAPVYVQQLLATGAGFAFAPGIAGIAYLCARRAHWKQGALLGLIVLPVTLLYMAYPQIPHAQSMRFLLPTFPVYMIAAAWSLREVSGARPAAAAALAGVLLLLTASWGLPLSVTKMKALEQRHAALARVARQVERSVPRGSVLIAGELVCHDLDVYGQWRLACTTALSRNRTPLYGTLAGEALYDAFFRDVQAWAGGKHAVYWLGNETSFRGFSEYMRGHYTMELLAEIPVRPREWEDTPGQPQFRMTGPGARNPGMDQAWVENYNLGPAPEAVMDYAFHSFAAASPVRLYKLTAGPAQPRARGGADQ